jgi:uncharacterized circularly permuted ATP-grasp superfamily protein
MVITADSLLATQYCPPADTYDELCTGAGQVRAHWQYLTQVLGALGPVGLERHSEEVRRLLREYSVTYHVYGDPQGKERPWDLDPIPLLISSSRVGEHRIQAGSARRDLESGAQRYLRSPVSL